jgi:hypothetical protein
MSRRQDNTSSSKTATTSNSVNGNHYSQSNDNNDDNADDSDGAVAGRGEPVVVKHDGGAASGSRFPLSLVWSWIRQPVQGKEGTHEVLLLLEAISLRKQTSAAQYAKLF